MLLVDQSDLQVMERGVMHLLGQLRKGILLDRTAAIAGSRSGHCRGCLCVELEGSARGRDEEATRDTRRMWKSQYKVL